jgi:hypothetical protein
MDNACRATSVSSTLLCLPGGSGTHGFDLNYSIGLTRQCCNIPSGFDFSLLILVFIYLDFCFIACISCKPPQIFC